MKDDVRERYAQRALQTPDAPDGTPPTLGLGDVVALAALRAGETVLDLGSGPGRDLLAAARAVGPGGRSIGIDMTPEMVGRAREAARATGLGNVAVLEGDLEALPVPCGSVDVVVSNCVINLTTDKRRVLVEAFRALAPGGRLAVLDTAFDAEPPAEVREDADSWCSCVAGALTGDDFVRTLLEIGFQDVSVEYVDSECGESCAPGTVRTAAVTARKPGSPPGGARIRPAVAADEAAIHDLVASCDLPLEGLAFEDAVVAVDGQVAGVVAVERHGPAALLRSLAVRPDRRRTGIGRKLVLAALEVARWSGAHEVYACTRDVQRYLEPFGFVAVSRTRAQLACPSPELDSAACRDATAVRLSFEEADLPLLGKPSRKPLPTFQDGACC